MELEFSQQIFEGKKILSCKIYCKNVQWEPSSILTAGRTDVTKLIVAFHIFMGWRLRAGMEVTMFQGSGYMCAKLFN